MVVMVRLGEVRSSVVGRGRVVMVLFGYVLSSNVMWGLVGSCKVWLLW